MHQSEFQKLIAKEAKGLPEYALEEVLDFIHFLRAKLSQKSEKNVASDNLSHSLTRLGASETEHLEEEFKNYKTLYPRES